jgi:hypothetical protein
MNEAIRKGNYSYLKYLIDKQNYDVNVKDEVSDINSVIPTIELITLLHYITLIKSLLINVLI